MSKSSASKESIVTLDRRRGDRRDIIAKAPETKVEKSGEPRRKAQRRRQIDPTTCERDYSDDEVEFMQAMEAYKRKNGRMFPTCSEVLEVVRSLGYAKPVAIQSETNDADFETITTSID